MKRNKKLRDVAKAPEISTFWEGTPREYEKRVDAIKARCGAKCLPVPTREWIIICDAFDDDTPRTVFIEGKLQQVGNFVTEIETTLVEFDRLGRQEKFDLIRRMTGEGSTMPEGYLDRVFEQYEAAERIGQ